MNSMKFYYKILETIYFYYSNGGHGRLTIQAVQPGNDSFNRTVVNLPFFHVSFTHPLPQT